MSIDKILESLRSRYGLSNIDSDRLARVLESFEDNRRADNVSAATDDTTDDTTADTTDDATDDTTADRVAAAVDSCTVGETYFLRHAEHFEWLQTCWLAERMRRHEQLAPRVIRVLSAGCSTGEEPYSLAAMLYPTMRDHGFELEVVAVDVNRRNLDVARRGTYRAWSLRGVSPDEHRSWLLVRDNQPGAEAREEDTGAKDSAKDFVMDSSLTPTVAVADWVKQRVSFHRHNILEPLHALGLFDLIMCRNLLIYLHPVACDTVWKNLSDVLAPEGVILCGPCDPGPAPNTPLRLAWTHNIRVYMAPGEVVPGARLDDRPAPAPAPAPAPTPAPARVTAPEPPPPRCRESATRETFETSQDRPGFDKAVALVQQGQLTHAFSALEDWLVQRPIDVEALLLKATLATWLARPRAGLEAARRAAYLAPRSAYAAFVLGDMFARADSPKQAAASYRWADELLAGCDPEEPVRYATDTNTRQLRESIRDRQTKNGQTEND